MEVEEPKQDNTIFISTSLSGPVHKLARVHIYVKTRHNKVTLEAAPFTNPHTHLHVVSTYMYMYSVFQTRNQTAQKITEECQEPKPHA